MIQPPLSDKPLDLVAKLVVVFSIVIMIIMVKAISIRIPMMF